MSDYIRLAEAPYLVMHYPTCGTCGVDLRHDDDWTCPVCGTSWPSTATDGDTGTLYEEWSGETLEGETLDDRQASEAGYRHERAERRALFLQWGWCEHGMVGSCVVHGCPGGKEANPD